MVLFMTLAECRRKKACSVCVLLYVYVCVRARPCLRLCMCGKSDWRCCFVEQTSGWLSDWLLLVATLGQQHALCCVLLLLASC